MYDLKRPCDTSPDCEHRLCHVCEKRIRPSGQLKDEHVGAVEGWVRDRLCKRCMIEGHPSIHDTPQPEPEPAPEVLPDERHILLSDAELVRVREARPEVYAWHIRRRDNIYTKEVANILENNLPITAEKLQLLAALQSRPQ